MSVIDEYLANISPSQKDELEKIRSTVKRLVPEAEEVISYGMPVFKYNKHYLIGFAAFKDHMSIFPGSGPIEAVGDKLSTFKTSKGTVQFTVDHPIPETLIKEIVSHCLLGIPKK